METPIWKDIPGFVGLYEVSNCGLVRSFKTKRIKSANVSGTIPYLKLILADCNHRRWNVTVHSLVMRAFVGQRPENLEINHKNGNKLDNRLSNLEYVTRSENIRHAIAVGLMRNPPVRRGEAATGSKLNARAVLSIRERHALGESIKLLADSFGVSYRTVKNVLLGISWAHVPTPVKDEA